MMPLFALGGMVAYFGMLVLLGVNHWALDFRAETGHPTGNDLVLLAIGLGCSAAIGVLVPAIFGAKRLNNELEARISDLENIDRYYSLHPQALVEARLMEVANLWQESRLALGKAHLYSADAQCHSEVQASRQEIKRCYEWVEQYERTFNNIYEHAKRVFGDAVTLKEKCVELYVTEKKAA